MKRILQIGILVLASAGCTSKSTAANAHVPNVLVAQKGVGAQFGSRDPFTCSSKTFPKSGPITADMARQYIICGVEEGDGSARSIWLLEDVTVDVGKGVVTHYITKADQDPNGRVYALRGSLKQYLCHKVQHGEFENAGKNCALTPKTSTTGKCYRTTFGDWTCSMNALEVLQIGGQPPPQK